MRELSSQHSRTRRSASPVWSSSMIQEGTLLNFVGGRWELGADEHIPVNNPATREVLARVPLSSAAAVARAVCAAAAALPEWRRTPPGERIQPLFRLKALLDAHYAELSRIITLECGKTLAESDGEMHRGVEN